MNTTAEDLLAAAGFVDSKVAKTTNRDRENMFSQRENNSITKNLKLKTKNSSPFRDGENVSEVLATSSPLGPFREDTVGQQGFVSVISGAEVQMKMSRQHRQQAYITLQTHAQVAHREAMSYTAYLVGRERGREFKIMSAFDQAMYDHTVTNKHLMIAHLCERKTKCIMNDVVVTYDPDVQVLTLWFNDYSGIIEINTQNKPLTENQTRFFVSAGTWGQPIQLPGTQSRGFLSCSTRVGGRA